MDEKPPAAAVDDEKEPIARTTREETGFYQPYADYHRNVRFWLLAYGIGAPAFLVQFPGAIDALKAASTLRYVTVLFLVGVAIQLVAALLYKSAMWYLYIEELGHLDVSTRRYRWSAWLSGAYWLELLMELSSLVLFGIATWRALKLLT
jgi:hypothetical protein